MSTFWKKDSDDLQRLIAGDEDAWADLQLAWSDSLQLYARKCMRGDWEDILVSAWTDVRMTVSKWKPGIDEKVDKKTGETVLIHTALTLNYVKSCIRNGAIEEGRLKKGPDDHSFVRLDKRSASHGKDAGQDEESPASILADRPDRGRLIETELLELVALIESAREASSDEHQVREGLLALIHEGLLHAEALDLFMAIADPPLTALQEQCMIRRHIDEQSYLQIGRDLLYPHQASTGEPANNVVTNRASSLYQSALRRVKAGLKALGADGQNA